MSTRELRSRTPKITGAFNASKLAIKKKSSPQKPVNGKLPPKTSELGPLPSLNTATQDEQTNRPLKPSGTPPTPPTKDEPSDPITSSLSLPPPNPHAKKSNPKSKNARAKPPAKKNKFKYPPGTTPYPSTEHPTPAECIEVISLLTAAHGPAVRPETIPIPDNSVSGCGEVPSVLDALARTVLSANTTNANSSRAFKGLLDAFGMVPHELEKMNTVGTVEGAETKIMMAKRIGQGSVDWDNVRRASMEDVVEAIKTGGLAVMKAKHIKNILDVVWEETQEMERVKKEGEIKTDMKNGDLSLEHLRDMGDDAVMEKLMSFNGVGCKTASCVAMFCLGRPKFPVDTHVWRISKYLSWIPEKATREDAYHHLDTRIPNDLKYPLHCLLIRHGRTCKHCKAGPESASTPIKKLTKRPRSDCDGGDASESPGKRMKTRKIWVGTGMMKEVMVEVSDDEIEQGPKEESLEACVLEQLIAKRARKLKKA